MTCQIPWFGAFGVITARQRSLRRLCFLRCLSVYKGGVCPIACWDTHTPGACWDTHPPGRHPPPCAVHARIRSTSRRYASHWHVFLLHILFEEYLGKFILSGVPEDWFFACFYLSTELQAWNWFATITFILNSPSSDQMDLKNLKIITSHWPPGYFVYSRVLQQNTTACN